MTAFEHPHAVWRTSSLSANGADCVQVGVVNDVSGHKADPSQTFLVRDSKNPNSGTLAFTPTEWRTFLGGVKSGEFNDLV
ncbi:DUF397 domain-containing protein [Streptosporangium sp. NBC_01469]|uniref:DUF397 domain-containing protein n=1 Tax=Streptosporangium sp. NBC_01469 TaxID=2903898 RepID=UPI002E2CC40B|nr:DUF397 domain-containing protein [Streptosporangium sp. NBC_01469]